MSSEGVIVRVSSPFFLQLYCPMGFSNGKFGFTFPAESQLRQSRATQTTVHAGCFSVSIIHRTLTWTTGSLTCDVNACDRTQGCTDTVRESALKADLGRKIARRTGESNLRQRRADPTLYQLSYIPTPLQLSI